MAQPLWKGVGQLLIKLYTYLMVHNSPSKEIKMYVHKKTRILIEALFVIAYSPCPPKLETQMAMPRRMNKQAVVWSFNVVLHTSEKRKY